MYVTDVLSAICNVFWKSIKFRYHARHQELFRQVWTASDEYEVIMHEFIGSESAAYTL